MIRKSHVLKHGSLSVAAIVGGGGKPCVKVWVTLTGRGGSCGGTVSLTVSMFGSSHVGNDEQLPGGARDTPC